MKIVYAFLVSSMLATSVYATHDHGKKHHPSQCMKKMGKEVHWLKQSIEKHEAWAKEHPEMSKLPPIIAAEQNLLKLKEDLLAEMKAKHPEGHHHKGKQAEAPMAAPMAAPVAPMPAAPVAPMPAAPEK